MPRGKLRSKLIARSQRPKTKTTCNPGNPVPVQESSGSVWRSFRRGVKKVQLAFRRKVHRDLNFIDPRRGPSRSQQRRNMSSVIAHSKQESIYPEQRSLQNSGPRVVLRCARTPQAADREKVLFLDLPQDVRDKVFDYLIEKDHFKVPATSSHTKLSFATDASVVSYIKGIPPVNHQFYDDFIAAVCRHPSCCMIITIRDISRAHYYRRKRQIHPLLPPIASAEFYPGEPVRADVVMPRAPQAYSRHIRDLRLHCVIDRSDLGTDTARLNQQGMRDTTPSIQEVLAICDRLPNLQHCDIHVYFTVREIRGVSYSLLWIDDCLRPLAILPTESTAVQVMIPVTDSRDTKDPNCQIMKAWRACPGGPDEADWLHHGHPRDVKDLNGVWNCYRCLRDNQLLNRYKRMDRGWIPRREGSAYFQTSASRWRDESTGAMVTNVLHQVVDPTHPIPPPQPHDDPRLEFLTNLFASYNATPGFVYPQQPSNQFTLPASRRHP